MERDISARPPRDRLRMALRTLKFTNKAFAKLVGCTASSITEVLKGRVRTIPMLWMKTLAEHRLNIHWLITGRGPLFLDQSLTGREVEEAIRSALPKLDLERKWICYRLIRNWVGDAYFERHDTMEAPDIVAVPLYGNIAAGALRPNIAMESEYIDIPKVLLPSGVRSDRVFALVAAGDSMIHAGIHEGDYVILDRNVDTDYLSADDIYAVQVDDEATLKRIERTKEKVILRAANPEYPEIHLESWQQVQILGRVILLYRRYST